MFSSVYGKYLERRMRDFEPSLLDIKYKSPSIVNFLLRVAHLLYFGSENLLQIMSFINSTLLDES